MNKRTLLSSVSKQQILTYEIALIGAVLFVVSLATSVPLLSTDMQSAAVIWLSALAVLVTFIHGAKSFDVAETASNKQSASAIGIYWISKEFLWLAVFLLSGAYPAIVGTGLFILYPLWRKCSWRPA